MVKHDGQCDFVKQVAIPFPLRVIMSILGVPAEDEAFMLKLTQELLGPMILTTIAPSIVPS